MLIDVNPELLKQATAGNASAQFNVALVCLYGTSMKMSTSRKDIEDASLWFEKAANNGVMAAAVYCEFLRRELKKNTEVHESEKKTTSADLINDPLPRISNLSRKQPQPPIGPSSCCSDPIAVNNKSVSSAASVDPINVSESSESNRGYKLTFALFFIGMALIAAFFYGTHYYQSYKKNQELSQQEQRDVREDPYAMYLLGKQFIENNQSVYSGVELLRRAADAGYSPAASLLGDLYSRGKKVNRNKPEAVYWYSKACKDNNYYACKRASDLQ